MVLRTSNGFPFTVLAPEPTVRTGIRVEVYQRADPATLIDVLPDTRAREWLDEFNGVGSGSFEVAANDAKLAANPTILDYGNVVRFYLNGVLRAGFRIEAIDRVQAREGDDAQRWLKVSGRGPLSILESATAYPQPDGNPYRGFGAGDTPSGLLMGRLIDEAQARGSTLAGVTYAFTDTLDSVGIPWARLLQITEKAGTDLLRIALRHAELTNDVYMTPQLELVYLNNRGVDRTITTVNTGAVVLALGRNITELTNAEVGRITNALLIETPGGYFERTDGPSIVDHGRREGFLSLGNIADTGSVDFAAEAIFTRLAEPAGAATLELIDVDGATPYVDFELGDWVLAPNAQGQLEKVRVRSLAVTETPDGRVRYVPQLATIEEELETRLNQTIAAMSKGTLGGSGGRVAEPTAPSEITVVTTVNDSIASHLALAGHAATLDDLDDVDTTTTPPINGDALIWDNALGLWLPASPAGAAAVPQYLNALAAPLDSPVEADEFDDGSLAGAWSTVNPSGTQELVEGRGVLSVRMLTTFTSEDLGALLRPLPAGAATFPLTIETAVRVLSEVAGNRFCMAGPILTTGTADTAGIMYCMVYPTGSGYSINGRSGTLTAAGTNVTTLNVPLTFGWQSSPLYMRTRWTASNTFQIGYSPDGVTWFYSAAYSLTRTPTHYGLAWSSWGDNPNGHRWAIFDYVRIYAS